MCNGTKLVSYDALRRRWNNRVGALIRPYTAFLRRRMSCESRRYHGLRLAGGSMDSASLHRWFGPISHLKKVVFRSLLHDTTFVHDTAVTHQMSTAMSLTQSRGFFKSHAHNCSRGRKGLSTSTHRARIKWLRGTLRRPSQARLPLAKSRQPWQTYSAFRIIWCISIFPGHTSHRRVQASFHLLTVVREYSPR